MRSLGRGDDPVHQPWCPRFTIEKIGVDAIDIQGTGDEELSCGIYFGTCWLQGGPNRPCRAMVYIPIPQKIVLVLSFSLPPSVALPPPPKQDPSKILSPIGAIDNLSEGSSSRGPVMLASR